MRRFAIINSYPGEIESMKAIKIQRENRILKGKIQLPGSKSISNRLLILRELASEPFEIEGLSAADDTSLLVSLLDLIRANMDGMGLVELDCRNAGTVMRFLTAYLARIPGRWVLTGTDRMLERPIGTLVDGLCYLGAEIDYLAKLGYPPLLIRGKEFSGNSIVIDPGISSQFVTSLLLIAPVIPGGLSIRLGGTAVSMPYINMSVKLLQHFGVNVKMNKNSINVQEGPILPQPVRVESDWSAASAWYEMAAFSEKTDLILEGLTANSLQGDSMLASVYTHFGVETEFLDHGIRLRKKASSPMALHFNFTDHPDIAQPLITTAAFLGEGGNFLGLGSLMIKETDRLKALMEVLGQFGVHMERFESNPKNPGLRIGRCVPIPPGIIRIPTYGDHRMALSFAPLAMLFGEVTVENPDVVDKSYPGFWNDLQSVGFVVG